MTTCLAPYPEYRSVGLPWLHSIPSTWTVLRAKFVFDAIDVRTTTGDEELLTVSANHGVVPRQGQNVTMFMAESYVGHKLCWPGDLVINSLWAWMRGLGVSNHHGIVSSAYGVYRPKPEYSSMSKYFDYLLRSPVYDFELRLRSRGIWTSRLQLTDEAFFDMPMVVPPVEDARTISDFLTALDAQVNRFIRNKRRLIELLNEQAASHVNDLLASQDSLGTTKLKHYVDLLPGFAFPSDRFSDDDLDIRLLRGINVTPGKVRWSDTVRWPVSEAKQYSRYQLQPDDLVIGMDRPWVSGGIRVALMTEADLPSLLLQRVARLRARQGLDQRYLHIVLTSPQFREYFEPKLTGISVPHISPEQILDFQLPVPSLQCQRKIVREYHRTSRNVAASISAAEKEIHLANEYRTRLVSDVVTGKYDVREFTRGNGVPDVDLDSLLVGQPDETLTVSANENGDGDAR